MPERIGLVAELDLTQFDRAVNSYIRSVNRMERATHNAADSMVVAYARLGGVIATTVGGVVAAMGTLATVSGKAAFDWLEEGVVDAANFEQQIAEIGAVLVKTREEVEPLAQLINKLALDPELVVSAEEAGAMVEQLARNGVEMVDILGGAANASILLANATGGDFAMAADVATMAMHMFNIEASNLNRIADVSQQVINNTRIELDDWKLALGNGGAVAASAGIDIEEFAATIQATINSFHSARQAGTSLMNFVQRLVPITKVAGDEMKKLGLFTGLTDEEFAKISGEIAETEQRIADLDPRLVHYDELVQAHKDHAADLRQELVAGKNAFFDETGTMKDWADVVNTLIDSTKGLSQEERTESFRRIFGNDAMETALALSRMTNDELRTMTEEYRKSGQAQAAAETRTATLAKRWDNLQDIWDSIRRLSGAKFIDMLFNLVNKLTDLTSKNSERVIDFFGRMAELLDRVVDASMPWIERMLPELIDNIEAVAHWLVELALGGDQASKWFNEMHPAIQRFINRIAMLIDIGKEFLGWLTNTIKVVREALKPFLDWVVANVTLRDALIAAAGAVAVFLAPLALLITRMAIAGAGAAKAVSSIRRAWANDFGSIRTIFQNTWPKIEKPLEDFVNHFLLGEWVAAWHDAVNVVVITLEEINRHTPDFFKPFITFVTSVLQGQWGEAWDSFTKIVANVFNAIKIGLDRLEHPFSDFILRILEGRWLDAWRIFQRTAINALTFLRDRLPVFFKPFASFITNVLKGDWRNAWDDLVVIAKNTYEALVKGLESLNIPFTDFLANVLTGRWQNAWEQIKNFASGAFEWIKQQLGQLNRPLTDFLLNVLEGKWRKAWDQIKNFAKGAFEWVLKTLRGFGTPFSTFLTNILLGKWRAVWKQIQNFAVGVFTWLKNNLPKVMTNLFEALTALVQGRWKDAWNFARNFVIEVLEEVREWFGHSFIGDMIDLLVNVFEGDWEGVWYRLRTLAIDALYFIRDHILPDVLDPIANMLINMINGDWKRAWDDAKKFVVGLRDFIVEWLNNFDTPFATFITNVLEGKWGAAWTQALNLVIGVRDWIVEWLTTFDAPFATFIANILEGKWGEAWNQALNAVIAVRDWIVEWLGTFNTPFADFIANVLEGDWKTAWENAKLVIADVKQFIVDWLADKGPWGTFLTDIIEGDWKSAWDTAYEVVFGEDGLVTKLKNWLADTGPWGTFAVNLLEGDFGKAWDTLHGILWGEEGLFTKLDNWLTNNSGPWSDFAKNVLRGEWIKAWDDLKVAVGLTDDVITAFKESIYILVGAFALAIATMVSFQVRGIMGSIVAIGKMIAAITSFIPIIAAIAVAVAVLRVAWENNWLGIQEFTAEAFKTIGQIVIVGVTIMAEVIDAYHAALAGDWVSFWAYIDRVTRLAWFYVDKVTLAGLEAIRSFLVDGVGQEIIQWFAVTFPETLDAVMDYLKEFVSFWVTLWQTAGNLFSFVWEIMMNVLQYVLPTWEETFRFMDVSLSTFIRSISAVMSWLQAYMEMINLVIGVVQTLGAVQTQVADAVSKATSGDLTGAASALDMAKTLATEVGPEFFQQQMDKITGNMGNSAKSLFDIWAANFDHVTGIDIAKMLGFDEDTAAEATSILTGSLDEAIEKLKANQAADRSLLDAMIIGQNLEETQSILETLFGLNSDPLDKALQNAQSLADILRPVFEGDQSLTFEEAMGEQWVSDMKALKDQIDAIISGSPFPDAVGGMIDPNMPSNTFEAFFQTLKELGVNLTGDFLNLGGSAIGNLGEGAEEQSLTVLKIFEDIMAEIKGVASGMVEDFKGLGSDIGAGLKEGLESQEEAVGSAAAALTQAAAQAIVDEAQIESPSKLFEELGYLSGEGYIEGWKQQLDLLEYVVRDSMQSLNTLVIGNTELLAQSIRQAGESILSGFGGSSGLNNALLQGGLRSLQTGQTLQDLSTAMQSRLHNQMASSNIYQRGTGSSYATTNSSSVQFGPIYVKNEMDGAQLLYRVKQVMDSARPV